MKDAQIKKRRQTQVNLSAERLESRALLTGGAGNTFALVTGSLPTAGQPAVTQFTLDADHFALPKRSLVLGIDAAPASNSTAKPLINAVRDVNGKRELPTIRSFYGNEVGQEYAGQLASAALVRVQPAGWNPSSTTGHEYAVEIAGDQDSTGAYLVGFYLPGDVDGDGDVETNDLNAIRNTQGAKLGQSQYNFNTDSNRDGKVNAVDLALAQMNKGVRTTVQPLVLASMDPASDSGTPNRITVFREVIFNGTATPGGTVTYREINGRTPDHSVQVQPDGTYGLMVALAEGENRFQVSSRDAFGQEISGQIDPVTYEKPLVPVTSPTTPQDPPQAVATPIRGEAPEPGKGPRTVTPQSQQDRIPAREDQAAKLRERLAALKTNA